MRKKIKAYTLMEVTIAMLLSAICISICYSAYGIIGSYYRTFQLKNETADAALSLRHVLEKDFLKSKLVLSTDSGLMMQQDSSTILYTFREKAILRELPELHTDTFKISYSGLQFFFEGEILEQKDTVDRMDLEILLDKAAVAKIRVEKKYSAENLFH
ncbi:hypothetical protein [Pedobacter sp. Leaf176]|uniref:hypothetical protein n=1 Tax=Pedobacter sp. Leaf176 TaxID=1736286 RepID=UPI0006F7FAD5|nr:hypothetical protein [Pedobacter sp. Leaf176]KQR70894.1 hypothetical protein ASF92_05665 [Pedobacter sp. Leaf176]